LTAARVPGRLDTNLPQTVGQLVREGARRFKAARLAFGHGTTNAFDEAAYLTLHALKLPLDSLEPYLDYKPARHEVARVLKLFERRVQERKPAAYLTREAWLGDFRFYVDERVIVPRSHIAELLRDDLAPWVPRRGRVRTALDLCTGSGCLAILLAHSFPRARVDACDLDERALAVARRNVAQYGLRHRIRLVKSDLFSALGGKRYDLIVSNPPYVRQATMRRLPPEYRHEPRHALAGGPDGLDFVRAIVNQAARHLNPCGLLVVEVGNNRRAVERAFPRLALTWAETSGGECVFLVSREELP
jgi:ribosomal protein L3 glutamine methyltransferase